MNFRTFPSQFECIEPMKKWKIHFQGICQGPGKDYRVVVDLEWKTFIQNPFDFNTDLAIKPLALSIAKEKWTIGYFKEFSESHQTHYEQWGDLCGTIQIEDVNCFLQYERLN